MAERGGETLRHGPMKPVGLTNPHAPDVKPYAVVQLRQDNALGTLCNMVGFQTKLKHGEQVRIFRTIPGPGERRVRPARRPAPQHLPQLAEAARRDAAAEGEPGLRFAGQITGCEGYVESAAVGLLAGRFAAAERLGEPIVAAAADARRSARCSPTSPAATSRRSTRAASFQPMNINFGLFPPLTQAPDFDRKSPLGRGTAKALAKKSAITRRALADLDAWRSAQAQAQAAE